VQDSGALLKPGMFARPRVVFSVREGALTVPEEALVPQGARQFVYKIVEGADGRRLARRIEARVGLRMPGKAEIVQGLSAGDQVVTAGQARLRGEETPVRLIDLSRPAGGTAAAGGRPPPAASAPGASGTTSGAAGAASAPSANGRRGPLQP
jgi:membrane fusion protein (multidrug efflux system)